MFITNKILNNAIGFLGAFLFLLAYYLNANAILTINDISYHVLNLFGAIFLGYRVFLDKNWSNFLLEVCFLSVAIYHIWRLLC